MKITLLSILNTLFSLCVLGQTPDSVTLDFCLDKAASRSVVTNQKALQSEILQNKLRNVQTNWLPATSLNAQSVYNSEVTDFSDALGNNIPVSIPSQPQDQYKIWADINQTLYDGGRNRALKNIENAGTEIELQQIETDQLTIRQQITQIYFGLLLVQKNTEVLQIALHELEEKKATVKAGVKYGVILEENLLSMDAEELALKQKLDELFLLKDQYAQMLAIYTETPLNGQMTFFEPHTAIEVNSSAIRPELVMFDRQKDLLDANKKMISSSDRPGIFAFSQIAYGRPGYNMMSSDFHTFYSIGVGLKWTFLNYGDNKRQKKNMDIQKNMIDIKRQYFNEQLQSQLLKEQTNIRKYDGFMDQDLQIITLRKEIASRSLSKLNNGVITATDYLSDMNAEITARMQYESHRILKLQSMHQFEMLQGKL